MTEQLTRIEAKLDQVLRILEVPDRSDQIGSDRSLNKDLSDQIRSDHYEGGGDLQAKFEIICNKYGLDISKKDIRGIDRSINWVLQNIASIRSPRAYLEKIISGCPSRVEVGFRPEPVKEADIRIMGLEPEEVESRVEYLDERTYIQIRSKIPGWQTLFPSFEAVMSSEMKRNVVTAYAIKEGLL